MGLENFANGPFGILIALALGRLLPPQAGYRLAEILGRRVAHNRESPTIRAVRLNQWVVSDCKANSGELDRITEQVLINHGRSLYDYFRYFRDREATDKMIILDESFKRVIAHSQMQDKAQLLVMPHYANFDLASIAAANHGLVMQALSYPNPGRTYRWQNKLRDVAGVQVTPISMSSLRMAIQNLKNKKTVFTAVDRPIGDNSLKPLFFRKPSAVPTGYIKLAIKTETPIQVVLCNIMPDGKYLISVTNPLPIVKDNDPVQEQLINVHQVLHVVEDLIRSNPLHWSMFYPVWPDLMREMP
ncbi:MAG: lysophospholipid acyltransferase family protein [Anaerolineales bacterium]